MKTWTEPRDPSVLDGLIDYSPDLYEYYRREGRRLGSREWNELLQVVRRTMRPRVKMRVDQFVDARRYVTQESSATPGKFRVSRYEILRGVLAAVTEKGVQVVTAIGPTQLYKSSLLECTALYFAVMDPKPMLLVQPNWQDAIDFMSDKIQPMFANTPVASAVTYKTTQNSVLFSGGHLKLASAKSEASLASRLAGVMLYDEIKSYQPIAGRYALSYGDKRLETYGEFGRSIRASSPKTEDNLAWKEYLAGDQRQAFVVCPHCGHDHVMRWKKNDHEKEEWLARWQASNPGAQLPKAWEYNVQWAIDPDTGDWDFTTAHYHCPECETEWSYGDRLKALDKFKVRWRQTKPFTCCRGKEDQGGGYQDPQITRHWTAIVDDSDGFEIVGRATCRCCGKLAVPNRHASFQASRLYSPFKLDLLVKKWKDAQGRVGGIQDFVNDELGEPWKDFLQIIVTADGLRAREEEYEFDLPERAVIITAGVDSHPDRFEVEVVAWGRNFESWTLDYEVIPGRPDHPETLAALDAVLTRIYEGKDGRKQRIAAVCIDSGGTNDLEDGGLRTTRAVYQFCLPRIDRNVWPIKGKNETGAEMADAWPKSASTNNTYQIPLYVLGTTRLKNDVHGQLAKATPGPGYAHFRRGRDPSWYTGLLGEKKVQKKAGDAYRWVPKDGARNEPFDCRVYALAALEGMKAKYRNPSMVEMMADQMKIPVELTESERERFTEDEVAKIIDETKRSIEQNRAKPITARKKPGAKSAVAKLKPTESAEGVEKSPEVARTVPNALQSEASGRRSPGDSDSPARVPVAPWRRKKR